jgi:hypothetical protein
MNPRSMYISMTRTLVLVHTRDTTTRTRDTRHGTDTSTATSQPVMHGHALSCSQMQHPSVLLQTNPSSHDHRLIDTVGLVFSAHCCRCPHPTPLHSTPHPTSLYAPPHFLTSLYAAPHFALRPIPLRSTPHLTSSLRSTPHPTSLYAPTFWSGFTLAKMRVWRRSSSSLPCSCSWRIAYPHIHTHAHAHAHTYA